MNQATDKVPSGVVQVPVVIDDKGTVHNTTFYAGAMLAEMVTDTAIAPTLDWAIAEGVRALFTGFFCLFKSLF